MNLRKAFDSGLAIIIFIIVSLLVILFYLLLFVKYEWCPVLYKNNTVSLVREVAKNILRGVVPQSRGLRLQNTDPHLT
jgi:hypothetical protein